MGLKCSPDYAQEVMENIFRDAKDAEFYTDDIGAFSQLWDDHIALLTPYEPNCNTMGSGLIHLSVNGQSRRMID
jgi:hypothetical protein